MFTPTMNIRILKIVGRMDYETEGVLQQMFQGSGGTIEWRNVEVIEIKK